MGFFRQTDRHYDAEIEYLSRRSEELSVGLDKCSSDNIALGIDFKKYKEELAGEKDIILDEIKGIWSFLNGMNADLAKFKEWKDSQEAEQVATAKAKECLPDTLTYKEVCNSLKEFRYMSTASFKYYLYECGLLDLKINPIHNTYKISENFASTEIEIKKFINVTNGAITFDKGVLEYLTNNPKDLQEALNRYTRRLKQYHKSKENISETQVKNYRKEIGKICGITDSTGDNYNGQRWGMVYKRYGIDHNGWEEKCKEWKKTAVKDRPWKYQKHEPTKLEYLIEVCGDGDVLLKIACELFVN